MANPNGRKVGGVEFANRGRKINEMLWAEARENRWERVRKACSVQLDRAADGDLASLAWIFNRLAGSPTPMLPDMGDDRSFAITWQFGPTAIEHEPARDADATLAVASSDSALSDSASSDPAPLERSDEG